jgi:hypothetical protein
VVPKFEAGHPKMGGRTKGVLNKSTVIREKLSPVQKHSRDFDDLSEGLRALKAIALANKIPIKDTDGIEELAKQYAPIALASLAFVATRSPSHPARVTASIALLDRAFGRPNQAVQLTGTLAVRTLSDEELASMAARMVSQLGVIDGAADEIAGELGQVATQAA